MFNKVSHEFLYDVSKEAVIKYLNDNGHKIRNLNDMNDEMISFLWPNRLHLYSFARENGLHNKPVTKFSPDEEGLPTYGNLNQTNRQEKVVRGINNLNNARVKMYFLLKGCNDNTYFHVGTYDKCTDDNVPFYKGCVFEELIEVHIDEVDLKNQAMYTSIRFKYGISYQDADGSFLAAKNYYFADVNNYFMYYDERLNRYRFFNKTGNTIKWENK